MKVLFFGPLADLTGTTSITCSHLADTEQLLKKLSGDFPQLANRTFAVAVNKKIQVEKLSLEENDIVALLPPFSGG